MNTLAVAGAVIAVVAALVIAAPPASASFTYRWAGWDANANGVGVDGYIRGSTTSTLHGDQARVNWINVCNSDCSAFVQAGECQGKCNTFTSYSAEDVYTENMFGSCFYHLTDYGPPASANQAYYLYWNGSSINTACGTEYQFYVKVGSMTSSPIATIYLTDFTGDISSKTELHVDGTVPENTDYYGTDNSHNPNSSYGMHIKTSGGSWVL